MKHEDGAHYKNAEWRMAKEREIVNAQANPEKMLELRFFKDGDGWFADVPEHTQSENRMVMGADALIDRFAEGAPEVTMRFRTVEPPSGHGPRGKNGELLEPIFKMHRIEHDPFGASYLVTGLTRLPLPAWICNVTETVLGEHPKNIFVYEVTQGDLS